MMRPTFPHTDTLNKTKESSRKTRVELQKGKPFFLLH